MSITLLSLRREIYCLNVVKMVFAEEEEVFPCKNAPSKSPAAGSIYYLLLRVFIVKGFQPVHWWLHYITRHALSGV